MKRFTFLLFAFAMAVTVLAQDGKPLSPKTTAQGKIGAAKITVEYSAPSARGRKMLGEKEPFGKVWRTGANAATTIEFDKAVKIEGKDVPAGKYALFTIPNEKEWTIIISKKAKQNGAYDYKQEEDLLRVNVPATKTSSFVETFTITVGSDAVELKWENTAVAFKVKG